MWSGSVFWAFPHNKSWHLYYKQVEVRQNKYDKLSISMFTNIIFECHHSSLRYPYEFNSSFLFLCEVVYLLFCLIVIFCFVVHFLFTVRRAATFQGRVTAGTPRRWPRLFRSTTTHWGPCTLPENIPPHLSTFLSHPASLNVQHTSAALSHRAEEPRAGVALVTGTRKWLHKDVTSQRGVTATLCNLKPACCFRAPARTSHSPPHLLCRI